MRKKLSADERRRETRRDQMGIRKTREKRNFLDE
jgi:hypothetical protein